MNSCCQNELPPTHEGLLCERWDHPEMDVNLYPARQPKDLLEAFQRVVGPEVLANAYPTWFKDTSSTTYYWEILVDGASAGWGGLRECPDGYYNLGVGLFPVFWNRGVRPRAKTYLIESARCLHAKGVVTRVNLTNPRHLRRVLREANTTGLKLVGIVVEPPPGYCQFCLTF